MLKNKGNYFILSADGSTLLLKAEGERAELVYFGEKLSSLAGADLLAAAGEPGLGLFSQWGKTDFREPSLLIRHADGSASSDFRLRSARIARRVLPEGLPASYGEDRCVRLEFFDPAARLALILQYAAYAEGFSVSAYLENNSAETVTIERFASLQLELFGTDFSFTTFDGAWGSERQRHTRPLVLGKCENASYAGSSSHFHNPLTLLSRTGEAYCVNLVYSGNHRTAAEADCNGRTRLIAGINPFSFSWKLSPGGKFFAPEGIVTFGAGEADACRNMRNLIAEHIVPKAWKMRERPVLVNHWEGTYFSFTREKILSIARAAAEVGAELFVLDDGWFGRRDDDTSSLGDWTDYAEKTGGIASLAEEIRGMGLKFGIWMEPEMISPDSELFRAHPEYCMRIPGREPVPMRNQLMLDLTDRKVREFIVGAVSRVIEETGAEYVKWDYNRYMTDCFGPSVRGGEYFHRYILGLYEILSALTEKFPDVLFEGCASGGGRFDPGMLCFMPQIWTSDNTDARERVAIQSGTACGYPQSTMGAHVSASPNEQTGNRNSLETRFHVACGGVLGYELDLSACTPEEREEIRAQIAFYKRYRSVLQFGEYFPLKDSAGKWAGYLSVSKDRSAAVAVVAVFEKRTSEAGLRAGFAGLDERALYRVTIRRGAKEEELGTASGELLVKGRFPLCRIFAETDERENSNPLYTRMYLFERTEVRR